MKSYKWAIVLLILVIIDSISTAFLFNYESNYIILWAMKTFNMNLFQIMIVRIFYCLPFIIFLNWRKLTKHIFFVYCGIYSIFFIMSYVIEYFKYGVI